MQVTMRYQISGTRDGQDWPGPGHSIDLTDGEAETMQHIGAAVPADSEEAAQLRERFGVADVETASVEPAAETAAAPAKSRTRQG